MTKTLSTFSPVAYTHYQCSVRYELATGDYSYMITDLRTGRSVKAFLYPSPTHARKAALQHCEALEAEACRTTEIAEAV